MRASFFSILPGVELPHATALAVPWSPEYDDIGVSDPGKRSRICIPSGISRIRMSCGIVFSSHDDTARRQIYSRKNGGEYPLGYLSHTMTGGYNNGSSVSFSAQSGLLDVRAGDFFEIVAIQNSGVTLSLSGTGSANACWLLVEDWS